MDRLEQEQIEDFGTSAAPSRAQVLRDRLRAAQAIHTWSVGEFFRWAATILIALIAAAAITLWFLDWNSMRGPVARYVSGRIGRPVAIGGNLKVHLFTFTPSVSADDVIVGNPPWLKQSQMAVAQNLTFKVRLLPWLFGGEVYMPLVSVDHPDILIVRDANGRTNWDFNGEQDSTPTKIPPIQHFIINQGHVEIHDARRKMSFTGTVSSHEDAGARNAAFTLDGGGLLNGRKFTAEVHGGPLINIDVLKPYSFKADIHAGPTHVVALGEITHPFDLGGMVAFMDVTGPNLNQLYYLTGLAWPGTPPYHLKGHLVRDGAFYKMSDLSGTVGNTDMSGWIAVDATAKPYLTANLTSRVLDFDDLGPLLGAPPPAKERSQALAAGATQAEVAPMQHLLPDVPLHVDRIRQMNADVDYNAEKITSRDFPLRRASTHVKLKDGVLTLDPMSFAFAQGKLAGSVQIDARKDIPVTDVDARLTDLKLEQFVSGNPPPVEGLFAARARLHGAGLSIQAAANNASGTITGIVPSGKMRAAFAELTGINVLNGLGLLLSGDKSDTNMRCAVAHFSVDKGVMTARHLVLDTDPVLITGSGTVDLDGEKMDLTLNGHPKKFRFLHLRAPITLTGPLDNPKVGISAGKVLPQAGLALGLALLSPLAALIPFVDPGLAKDANCAAAMSEGQKHGTPMTRKVKAAAGHRPK